jgi:hypothetical protein
LFQDVYARVGRWFDLILSHWNIPISLQGLLLDQELLGIHEGAFGKCNYSTAYVEKDNKWPQAKPEEKPAPHALLGQNHYPTRNYRY